jgi:peptide/nickel transport system substrate-binding protein
MRRRLALVLALLASLIALPGAGPSFAQTPPAPRVVSVALAQEPDRFYAPTTQEGQLVANLVFDPLVGLDDQMNPYPVLAAMIPSPDNGLVRLSGDGADRRVIVTMPLRQDVTWSDGQPFTADDVVYTWQLMMNPRSPFDTSVEDKLKSVDKVDDFTVQFTYLSANEARALDPDRYKDQGSDPVIDPLYFFGLYDAPAIYPRHKLRDIIGDDPRHNAQVAALETSDFARNPVGTGPFVLSSWEAGSALTFTSRGVALSQRLGQPGLDSIVFRIDPDKNDSLTNLSGGQFDVVSSDELDPSDAPVLDTLSGVQAHYTPGNAWEHLTFNLDNPLLADPNVRQAFAYAIDRNTLNTSVMAGKAEVSAGQVPSWSWGFNTDLAGYDFNQAKANQLLDAGGWARGADGVRAKGNQRLSFKYWAPPAPFRSALMAAIRDQLAQVGISMELQSVPASQFFDTSGNVPQSLVARQFDVAEFAWVSTYDPATDALFNLNSANVPSRSNGYQGGNYGDYKNPRNDQLLAQLQASIDPAFRRIALKEAQTIWQSDLPVLPLLLRPVTTATSARLQGFRPTPAPAGETWNVEQWTIPTPPQ